MKDNKQLQWKKLGWNLLMILCVAVYALGLTLVSEAASRQEFSKFLLFLGTDIAPALMRNVALLTALLILTLYFLTRKLTVSMALVSVPMLLAHVINFFKLKLRNEPFYPWDITLAGEAANIVSSIRLQPSKAILAAAGYVVVSLVIAAVLEWFVLRRNRLSLRTSLACGLAAAAMFGICFGTWFSRDYISEHTVPIRFYNQEWSYKENGFCYAFASNYYRQRIEEPQGYDRSSVEAVVKPYGHQEGSVEPNVIIVMSEAFSDIWNSENLTFDEELAPTFTALAEQYLSGRCLTNEYGGNTANSEFEVLTGYSTAMLPTGTIAYMTHLNQKTDSVVSFLKSQDYYTVALHPYWRSFFSREKAYELLGFDDFYSMEHFEGAPRLRVSDRISDDAVADRIIAEYEKNEPTGRGFFCHTVTMLNHTSYYAGDWAEELQVGMEADCELTQTEYASLRSYATGVQYADAMLAKLVDYFSKVEEPTVLLFFGDHQPSLGSPGYELMQRIGYVADNTTDEGRMTLQSTPYLIWNNFEETPTAQKMDMSMFHLLPYMTRMLDMDRPGFHSYMDALFEEVRGVTQKVCLDGTGTAMLTLGDGAQAKFDEYLSLVYDGLIGKQYAGEFYE